MVGASATNEYYSDRALFCASAVLLANGAPDAFCSKNRRDNRGALTDWMLLEMSGIGPSRFS